MRGLCRWAQNCSVQNCGEAPSPSLRIADASHRRSCTKYGVQGTPMLSPHAGEVEKANPFSRRASRLFCFFPSPQWGEEAEHQRCEAGEGETRSPSSAPFPLALARLRERVRGRGSAPAGALASRRSTAVLAKGSARPQGSASGHVSCDLAGASGPQSPPQPGGGDLAPLRGRYPRRPVPVQRCTSRAGRSAGRHDAQAARERR